jgi:ParB/RepB/Spo0J family partition protein
MVAVDKIVSGRNARTVPVPPELDEGLRRSIAAVGVLQPVLLRPMGEPFATTSPLELVLGGRRFAAARALGLTEIPAEIRVMTDVEVEEAQVAENIQRQAMHPVDQWRAVRALIQDHGLTFEQAAGALGLDDRLMRRMEQLGRLNPALLKLAEIDMPTPAALRKIAAAPAKLQAQAAKIKDLIVARGDQESVDWHQVVMRCTTQRIARAVAIFDTSEKGLVWDEDLFAEPGADDQFTTADVDGFIKRQTKALQARVAALAKTKKRHQVATMKDAYNVAVPGGFKESWGKPERLKAHEWAFHAVAPDGTIKVVTAIDTKAAKAAERKQPAKPPADRRDDERADAKAEDADDDDLDGDDGPEPREPEAKPPFTKKGLALIAAAKTAALRKALDGTAMPTATTLALLVLALSARNVTVRGVEGGFDDLATRILAPGGNLLDLSTADIVTIGQTAIGRILSFEGADRGFYTSPFSGDAAEWVGAAIDAAAQLDRFDTAEFLETATVAELKRAAAGRRITGGNATALRERLIGRAPDYRPDTAVFGAPAPKEKNRG